MPFQGTWAVAPTFESSNSSHIKLGNIIADPASPFDLLQQVKPEDLTDFAVTEDYDPEGFYDLKSAETSSLDLGAATQILQYLMLVGSHHRPASEASDHGALGVRTRKLASTFPWTELRTLLEREPVLGRLVSSRPVYIVSEIMIAREFGRCISQDRQHETNLGTVVQPIMHHAGRTMAFVGSKRNDILFGYHLHKLTLDSEGQERQIQAHVHRPPAAFASVPHDSTNNGEEEGEETGSGGGLSCVEMTCEDWYAHGFQILPVVREETQSQAQTQTSN